MVNVLTPLAAEAGSGSIMPLWQAIVLGFFVLAALTMALVVWVVLRLTRQR
jgi:hypothetical protein